MAPPQPPPPPSYLISPNLPSHARLRHTIEVLNQPQSRFQTSISASSPLQTSVFAEVINTNPPISHLIAPSQSTDPNHSDTFYIILFILYIAVLFGLTTWSRYSPRGKGASTDCKYKDDIESATGGDNENEKKVGNAYQSEVRGSGYTYKHRYPILCPLRRCRCEGRERGNCYWIFG